MTWTTSEDCVGERGPRSTLVGCVLVMIAGFAPCYALLLLFCSFVIRYTKCEETIMHEIRMKYSNKSPCELASFAQLRAKSEI